ncbi:MAG: ferrous iron transport protein B [Anaerolineales bacterium]|nr:ferrous iron transport protein B [Anaerolineales bacterium]
MNCHASENGKLLIDGGSIALVGQPNVGKSVIFQRLTGRSVTIANYPGTTVEVTRGNAKKLPETVIIDTPGVITLPSQTEDERVTAEMLLNEPLSAIVQVGDAKNLRRTLMFTLQLAELGIPMALALNMMDEANSHGLKVDHQLLNEQLDIAVVPTVAVRGLGINELTDEIQNAQTHHTNLTYPQEIEEAISIMEPHLPEAQISSRSLAILWLNGDLVAQSWIEARIDEENLMQLRSKRASLEQSLGEPAAQAIQRTRLDVAERLTREALHESGDERRSFASKLGQLAIHPLWGLLILAVVLLGAYWFVGIFGAGTLVGFLEEKLFNGIINPWIITLVYDVIPFEILGDLLVGEYGLWTMGMTYALALILPIVTTFFIAFGILEDSGYLPRLAVLSNRLFSMMGLNGKAVLPMMLGLGCVTMATLTTRILENRRDRLLVILLLALAIPCSAQLGIVMGMLASISLGATLIWFGVVLGIMLAVGWLAARLIPGERSTLLLELPPLRWPVPSNVLTKTLARLEWYAKEVIPLFLLGAAVLFVMDKVGLLNAMIRAGEPLVTGWLGLPPEASAAFLLGFMRRDFGATNLFMMESQGALSPAQVVVAMVTITLFIPCVASIFMIAKSRGWRTAAAMAVAIFPIAFLVGGVLHRILGIVEWGV